jgi:hypothetical protein
MTAETVAVETPAVLATSLMVAAIGLQQIDLAHYRRITAPRKAPKRQHLLLKLKSPEFFRLRQASDWGRFSETVSLVSLNLANQLGREGI